ncbi:MAG: hypothetical protein REI09_11920 [Candidatus Dactylopiibacterium sp.]|nr:hypothetical protein [Candidatus Dactylopiibacterium sp.]
MLRFLLPRCLRALFLLIAISGNAFAAGVADFSPEYWQAQRRFDAVEVLTVGDGPARAYVFKPATDTARDLPLVVFNHGWLGMNPLNFGGLIDLLVRRGAVLVYPVYQDGELTAPQAITRNAADATRHALEVLDALQPGLVDRTRTLYWGFSMGATISLNFALDPAQFGLPAPRALMLVAPGDAHHIARGERAQSIIGKVEALPADLPVLLVSGAADTGIGVPTARRIAARLCHVAAARRNLIFFPSDSDGTKKVQAGHGSPGAPDSRYDFPDPRATVAARIPPRTVFEPSGSLNQLDFHGYWRLSVALLDYAAGGDFPARIFSRTEAANFDLGNWPDGRPYARAYSEDPCAGA